PSLRSARATTWRRCRTERLKRPSQAVIAQRRRSVVGLAEQCREFGSGLLQHRSKFGAALKRESCGGPGDVDDAQRLAGLCSTARCKTARCNTARCNSAVWRRDSDGEGGHAHLEGVLREAEPQPARLTHAF